MKNEIKKFNLEGGKNTQTVGLTLLVLTQGLATQISIQFTFVALLTRGLEMAINLDKAGDMITKALKLRAKALNLRDSGKTENIDNIAWWMRRYEWLCTSEAEEVVRQAMDKLNDSIALRDDALSLVKQLDHDIYEAGDEIIRLGGTAFVEKSQPMIEELKVYLDAVFESVRRR